MLITFGLLGLSICAAWLEPIRLGKRFSLPPWLLPFAGAIIAGLVENYLTWPALVGLGFFGFVTYMAGRPAASRSQQMLFGSFTTLLALALALHLLPGFHNPLLVSNIRFSPDAVPFTQYANFDKAATGLMLLALLANRTRSFAEWGGMLQRTFPVALVTIAVVMAAAIVAGYVRPEPKLSWYAPTFLLTNLLFVCVAEEAFFRGFLQEQLGKVLSTIPFGAPITVACSAMLFGAAHLGGGVAYAGIATVAGLGYAYAYAVTKRIEAPILIHFGLNAVHFVGFTYPRIQ